MMERCPRQPRMGETCGAKLTHPEHIVRQPYMCKTCKLIGIRTRQYQKLSDRIHRWSSQADVFPASLHKAQLEKRRLGEEIGLLAEQRASAIFCPRRSEGEPEAHREY